MAISPHLACPQIFLATFWPGLFAVAQGQRESLQVPKKKVKHGTQRLRVDEERLL
jgi:hypothetical protein